jgi:hypothetical protein
MVRRAAEATLLPAAQKKDLLKRVDQGFETGSNRGSLS